MFVRRDREEELIAVARGLEGDGRCRPASLDRVAVVFKRPLPYLYLAREVFGRAGLPYQTFDALPLAAEPFAAALDLVFEFVESGFTRRSMVALLRSPHFVFRHDGRPIDRESSRALDRALERAALPRRAGAAGGARRRRSGRCGPGAGGRTRCARRWPPRDAGAAADAAAGSSQFRCLIAFLDALRGADDRTRARGRARTRGRARVLAALAAAHAAHDDPPMDIDGSGGRRPPVDRGAHLRADRASTGVQLVDVRRRDTASSTRSRIVGLDRGRVAGAAEAEHLLSVLAAGLARLAAEKDRRGAADARFLELLAVAASSASAFRPSASTTKRSSSRRHSLDEIPRARLSVTSSDAADGSSTEEPSPRSGRRDVASTCERPASWRERCVSGCRRPDDAAFHGSADRSPRPWSVSALETYLGCPFKFFAQHVLRLKRSPRTKR